MIFDITPASGRTVSVPLSEKVILIGTGSGAYPMILDPKFATNGHVQTLRVADDQACSAVLQASAALALRAATRTLLAGQEITLRYDGARGRFEEVDYRALVTAGG